MIKPIKFANNDFLSSLDISTDELIHILELAKNLKTKKLNIDLKKSETYGDELRATLNKHNLTHLANKKPGMIEKRMQNATDKLWNDLESITSDTPTE